jgi:hypothetical protein
MSLQNLSSKIRSVSGSEMRKVFAASKLKNKLGTKSKMTAFHT